MSKIYILLDYSLEFFIAFQILCLIKRDTNLDYPPKDLFVYEEKEEFNKYNCCRYKKLYFTIM